MSVEPKPFQSATIDAAIRAFRARTGSRRFLVADEVGLGKTIVASGIVERISAKRSTPLRVFYVCSNLAIATQNLARLVSFLPDDKRKSAIAEVDRPSLMPTRDLPTHASVHVFSLTPDTALPSRRCRRREGRVEERALGLALLKELLPRTIPRLYRTLRVNVGRQRFDRWLRHYRTAIRNGKIADRTFRRAFRHALRVELGVEHGQHLPPRIQALVNSDDRLELVAAVRSALAVAALEQVRPDLVIFDEFQRFRDLLEECPDAQQEAQGETDAPVNRDAAASRVLRAIRGDGIDHRPALLLLSATPYTPYRGRREGAVYASAAADFFVLVKFLYGGGRKGRKASKRARSLFGTVGEELRKGTPLSNRAQSARADLTALLTRVMSRTERPRKAIEDGARNGNDGVREAPLLPTDISIFRHLTDCLQPDDHGWAVPLWQSVPLPMQALGNRYQAWRNSQPIPPRPDIALTPDMRQRLRTTGPWPHPRLRALLEEMPLQQLALPWVAPSLPWWPLGDAWKNDRRKPVTDGKLLVFSRFRAVPVALSGLVSYALEARLLGKKRLRKGLAYEDVTRRQLLAADPDRPDLFTLFHPSPILARLDPLARRAGTLNSAKVAVQGQLRAFLAERDIRVVKHIARGRLRPWELLAMIEQRAGCWHKSRAAWDHVVQHLKRLSGEEAGSRLQAMIDRWDAKGSERVSEIDEDGEFRPLVDMALQAPGTVLARALRRHWPDAFAAENFGDLADLCWRGLRSYFDAPWFAAALASGRKKRFPDAIRRAVIQGNLESVLDEHFWYLAMAGAADWNKTLAELGDSLRLRTSSIALHEGGPRSDAMRLRCHAAVPLNEARAGRRSLTEPGLDAANRHDETPWRPEEVRRAFNAPFWPHMLVTTSIGQEGLDFHPWCRTLAHWDLCSEPVALEQREGRISRFAGLSIRRAIVAQLAHTNLDRSKNESPWKQLAALASSELADETGLSPWWVAPGAETGSLVFTIPGSEQPARRAKLHTERALYRLVLGMPDQADLLELIAARESWDSETIREACLDLSALSRPKSKKRQPRT